MIEDAKIKEWFYRNRNNKRNEIAKILGVEYAHIKLESEDDIYITKYGLPFIENLRPENFWTDKKWFNENSIKLSGTSSIYKLRTKTIKGKYNDIVLKWNRMGQDIPGAEDAEELMNAEFNSPFEEFSLVMELRDTVYNSSKKIFIQNPLAIYVPYESVEFTRMGRKEYKMQLVIQSHKEIVLDMCRSYAVIYEWIQGLDAIQALKKGLLDERHMELLTLSAYDKINKNGFNVKDMKPHHVIVRPKKNKYLARDKKGEVIYGLVDFELLERTPEQERIVKKTKRTDYLKRQKDRFSTDMPEKFHPHLSHVNIFGVDYIYGHVESTKGRLWVVGKDPYLFDFFLPEQWEQTPKNKLSLLNEVYDTITKDNIHIVWKISNVGKHPDIDPFKEDEKKIMQCGYNSPFEEISIAMELFSKGIATIYPRAIYMTGTKIGIPNDLYDSSRYETHRDYYTPDGIPILQKGHNYILIWGYWNGPDEKLAAKDGDYYEGIDILRAYKEGIITQEEYTNLLEVEKERLKKGGFEDLNLRGNHLLISLDSTGNIVKDNQGIPEMRICNFEFLKK